MYRSIWASPVLQALEELKQSVVDGEVEPELFFKGGFFRKTE